MSPDLSEKSRWNEIVRPERGQTGQTGQTRQTAGLTCGEVDVGKKNDVCGDEGDELGNADLLLEVHVNHMVISQAAVGRRVELLQTCPQAAEEPGHT